MENPEPPGDDSARRRSITRRPGHRPNPLRVVLVTQGVKRGRLLNALIDHTDPDRVRYSIITVLGGDGPLLDDMAARDVEVHSLGMSDGSLESVPLALIRLRRALKTAQPDVVHSLLFYPSLTSELSRAAWLDAPPSLLVRHHNALHHLYGRRLHARLDKWMACHATQVVAVSHTVAHTLSGTEQVPPDRVTVIHNGLDWKRTVQVDPAAAASWRRQFGDRRLLVAAGRITSEKDYPTLLRTLVRVERSFPDVLLVIAGTGPDDERARLEQLARSLGIDRAAQLVGWVPDVYNLMAVADVFVQSSIDESFSQTIVEARGLGIPVAATTVGAVSEVLGGGHETIAAGDDGRLARRIISLLATPELARSEAEAAARGTQQQFSAQSMTDGYLALYKRLARLRGLQPARVRDQIRAPTRRRDEDVKLSSGDAA